MQTRVYTWDWKDQPDFETIGNLCKELGGGFIKEVYTGGDYYAIIISSGEISEEEACEIYNQYEEDLD